MKKKDHKLQKNKHESLPKVNKKKKNGKKALHIGVLKLTMK